MSGPPLIGQSLLMDGPMPCSAREGALAIRLFPDSGTGKWLRRGSFATVLNADTGSRTCMGLNNWTVTSAVLADVFGRSECFRTETRLNTRARRTKGRAGGGGGEAKDGSTPEGGRKGGKKCNVRKPR